MTSLQLLPQLLTLPSSYSLTKFRSLMRRRVAPWWRAAAAASPSRLSALVVPCWAATRSITAAYKTTLDFEPLVMQNFCDGPDVEHRDAIRKAISLNSEFRAPSFNVTSPEKEHLDSVARLRALAKLRLVSVAQFRSTPRKFLSLYEILASMNPTLAASAAAHFTMCSGLVATHGTPEAQADVLRDADGMESVGTWAHGELFTEEAPLATSAVYQPRTGGFILQSAKGNGSSKFPVINGMSAQWCVVVADIVVSNTNHGPHMFVVRLRDGRKVQPGVSVKPLGKTGSIDAAGAAMIRFDQVQLERTALLGTSTRISDQGALIRDDDAPSPLLPMVTAQRLATSAVLLGTCKRMMHDVVHYLASREVLGPFGELNHPLFGLQYIQNTAVSLLTDVFALNALYHTVTAKFVDVNEAPEQESYVQLALLASRLAKLSSALSAFSSRVCGAQGALQCAGFGEGQALTALIREGATDAHLDRLLAREVVTHGYGSRSLSAFVKNQLSSGFFKRFMSNPFFSPTSQEIARYLILFSDREFAVRTALSQKYQVALRNGPEDAFYMWNSEDHRGVDHLAQSYGDHLLLRSMYEEMGKCPDLKNRRVIRDMAWQWALGHMNDDLAWLLQERLFSPRHVSHLHLQFDNVSSNIAHQAVHLVQSFKITDEMITSPLGKDWEAYWSAAPTNSGASSSDSR